MNIEDIQKMIEQELILCNDYEIAIKNVYRKLAEKAIDYSINLGNTLWCLWDMDGKRLFEDETLNSTGLPSLLNEIYERCPIDAIKLADKFYCHLIKEKELNFIIEFIHKNLDTQDTIKLNLALKGYEKGEFYQCANILCGLIDSQNIKRNHKRWFSDGCRKTKDGKTEIPIGQSGYAFLIITRRDLLEVLLDNYNTDEELKDNKLKKAKAIKDRIQDNKSHIKIEKREDFQKSFGIINLFYAMTKFFEDYDWSEYPNNKPKIINRNWLMHGMYDINDVTQADCVKLILLLRQTISLYKSLGIEYI